uniref:ARMT1-like domain-containing protein n=1 Tax=Sulfurospirillum cavolei TaxID=366522 RepID=UPI003FA2FCAD
PTPGLAFEQMSPSARELYEKSDCILSKGMGNFECLNERSDDPIFFLFKVKCQVVAEAVGATLGDIVCKKS